MYLHFNYNAVIISITVLNNIVLLEEGWRFLLGRNINIQTFLLILLSRVYSYIQIEGKNHLSDSILIKNVGLTAPHFAYVKFIRL